MENGQVRSFAELERLTRRKHDDRLADHLPALLEELGCLSEPLQVVSVDSGCGRRFATADGAIAIDAPHRHDLPPAPEPAGGAFPGKAGATSLYLCSHELAHLGSSLLFTGGFEENSLLVHIDGGASISNSSIWTYRGGVLQNLSHSWELQPATANFHCNLLVHGILGLASDDELSVAGKLMGLAAYGEVSPELLAWLKEHAWFRSHPDPFRGFAAAAASRWGVEPHLLDQYHPLIHGVAACMQEYLAEEVLAYLIRAHECTGCTHLYFSGGTALNIKLNARLRRQGPFSSVFVPPCANDSGLAVGAAALLEWLQGRPLSRTGPFLNNLRLPAYHHAPRYDAAAVASLIAAGGVVGTCVGPAEIGPRALGHRSLLAHPSTIAQKDYVSSTLKQREWYRPVAPVVLKSLAGEFFAGAAASPLSRFMLEEFTAGPDIVRRAPGVVHVDGTSRVQVVDDDDPELAFLGELLQLAYARHHLPCLINTSFNRRGEPMVHTHSDALAAAAEMQLDAVICDNILWTNPASARNLAAAPSFSQPS
jgi:carbamoyltransferase